MHFFCNCLIFRMIVLCQFKEFWHFLRKKQKKVSFGLKEALSACVYIRNARECTRMRAILLSELFS